MGNAAMFRDHFFSELLHPFEIADIYYVGRYGYTEGLRQFCGLGEAGFVDVRYRNRRYPFLRKLDSKRPPDAGGGTCNDRDAILIHRHLFLYCGTGVPDVAVRIEHAERDGIFAGRL